MNRIEISSYEDIRDALRVRLADIKSGGDMLKNAVSEPAGCGYALVAYLDLSDRLPDGGAANIPRDFAEASGFSIREVMADAMNNSFKDNAPKLCMIQQMLFGGRAENLLDGDAKAAPGSLLVLTTESGFLGASALFSPGMQERIGEIVGGDYFVLPSSVHEVLIMADNGTYDPKELALMVKEINEHEVAPNERLGNRVMHYRADIRSLQVAADMDRVAEKDRERC